MNERQLLEELDSDFITKLSYAFQDDKHLYFVMDYVEGGDLFNVVQRQGRLDERVARTYIAELLTAIQYLHSKNVLYRDLKLENIMIDRAGHIKLVDMGAGCIDLGCNSAWGTVDYLSPHALINSKCDKANDLWALVGLQGRGHARDADWRESVSGRQQVQVH